MFHFFEKKKQRKEEDTLLLSYMEVRDMTRTGRTEEELTRQEFEALRRISDKDPVSRGIEREAAFRFLPRTEFTGKYFISYTEHPETVLAFRDSDLGDYVLLFQNTADAEKYMEKVVPQSPKLKLWMNTYDVIHVQELRTDGTLLITRKNGEAEAYKGDGELFRAALLVELKENAYDQGQTEQVQKVQDPEGPTHGKRKRYVSSKLRHVLAAGTDKEDLESLEGI